MKEEEKLQKKLSKLIKKKNDYEKQHSIHTYTSHYVGCKHCGSKLKISLVPNEKCVLCFTDLRGQTVLDTIAKYNLEIMQLKENLVLMKDVVRRTGVGTSFELSKHQEPEDEAYKAIRNFFLEKYGAEFTYANCARSDEFIVVVCKDFNHAKKYFSAWYDLFLFDLNGNLIREKARMIEGSAYSDFFIDDIDFSEGSFRLFMRSHLHPYSKCDDEYHAIWFVEISNTNDNFYTIRNPFVLHDRRSERGISVYNEHFSNQFGEYYSFANMDNHSALEISQNSVLLDSMKNKNNL